MLVLKVLCCDYKENCNEEDGFIQKVFFLFYELLITCHFSWNAIGLIVHQQMRMAL